MRIERMIELVSGLAEAKSRQDVAKAMTFQHPDMVLEVPAFRSESRGKPENEIALTRFFKLYPDYHVTLDGRASDGDKMICWGTVRMTMTGDRLGKPNGTRAVLPVFITFTFKDDLIASERFVFDLSELCAQSGVSTDAVRKKLFGARDGVAA